jgi:predicted alpha/beta-hydrolase family hydrolase
MSYTISKFLISVNTFGIVSAECYVPNNPHAVFVFAHGAGAGMDHTFMKELSHELAQIDIATMRYNFLYMEQGKKRPDVPARAHEVIKEAIDKAHTMFPDTPFFVGGKSYGGRMTSQLLAASPYSFVKGIIFVGFPLHPAKKPSFDRAAHLSDIKIPMLFLQGTKDALAEWNLISKVCADLPFATLFKMDGADHSFKIPPKNAIPFLAKSIRDWISKQL